MPTFLAEDLSVLASGKPLLWGNPALKQASMQPSLQQALEFAPQVSRERILDAQLRMQRFAPLLARLFSELQPSDGRISSALIPAPRLQSALGLAREQGQLLVKCDHSLPVAGSVKARGGFHEVLEFAERLALRHGLLQPTDDYSLLAESPARKLFSGYRVAVGSTGNLGMAIGVIAAALGFEAIVHMSAEAKQWKKDRLRKRGVTVVEHSGDYAQAVEAGRQAALHDPNTHFVDDERSLSLMLGYAQAGQELKTQLGSAGIAVDAEHPLFVYLPCGVGGAPAGISVGIKQALGPHAHCIFAEPTQAPCFVLRMLQPEGEPMSIYDIGLSNQTEADGLAVPRASELAVGVMRPLLSAAYTVQDQDLFDALLLARDTEDLRLEPSAAAGLLGPLALTGSDAGRDWLTRMDIQRHLPQATHVAWTTGGSLVPDEQYAAFLAKGYRTNT